MAYINRGTPKMRIAPPHAVLVNVWRVTTGPTGHSEIQSRTLLKLIERMLEVRIETTAVAVLTFPEAQWVLPKNRIVANIGIETCEVVALWIFAQEPPNARIVVSRLY